ncbi:hypothetical protein EJ06DRAFT_427160 [Trichodelitschia bisporula]|uniref:Uncharacterized protein n=1 Tax=Trichodelitschia bisporula TaxID=703511 RepID=A0A6G1HWG7_9PEZI|nr:hypothetical protein EJ06DRAFT_427160 [Trichodelitschia bisporula]
MAFCQMIVQRAQVPDKPPQARIMMPGTHGILQLPTLRPTVYGQRSSGRINYTFRRMWMTSSYTRKSVLFKHTLTIFVSACHSTFIRTLSLRIYLRIHRRHAAAASELRIPLTERQARMPQLRRRCQRAQWPQIRRLGPGQLPFRRLAMRARMDSLPSKAHWKKYHRAN